MTINVSLSESSLEVDEVSHTVSLINLSFDEHDVFFVCVLESVFVECSKLYG